MKPLGIIGAMDVEIELLKKSLKEEIVRTTGESIYYSGKINISSYPNSNKESDKEIK